MYKVILKPMIGEEQVQPIVLRDDEMFFTCYIMPNETEEEIEKIADISMFLEIAAVTFNNMENKE